MIMRLTIVSTPQGGHHQPDCSVCTMLRVLPPSAADWCVRTSDQRVGVFACGEHERVAERTVASGTSLAQTMRREGMLP